MATVKAARSGKKGGHKRKVTHIRISRTANGFNVHHELEPPPAKGKRMMMVHAYEPDPKPSSFETKDAAHEHVGKLMDGMGDDEPGAPAVE